MARQSSYPKTYAGPGKRVQAKLRYAQENVEIITKETSQQAFHRKQFGLAAFPDIDADSEFAIRTNELYAQLVEDFGGIELVTTVQIGLAKQVAFLLSMGEEMIGRKVARDETYDLLEHLVVIKTILAATKTVGIHRTPRPIGEVSLSTYMKKGKGKNNSSIEN